MRQPLYVIWSNAQRAGWKPNSAGYTTTLKLAGCYARTEALHIAALPAIITATSNGQHQPGANLEGATITEGMAHDAYAVADAMLRERGK